MISFRTMIADIRCSNKLWMPKRRWDLGNIVLGVKKDIDLTDVILCWNFEEFHSFAQTPLWTIVISILVAFFYAVATVIVVVVPSCGLTKGSKTGRLGRPTGSGASQRPRSFGGSLCRSLTPLRPVWRQVQISRSLRGHGWGWNKWRWAKTRKGCKPRTNIGQCRQLRRGRWGRGRLGWWEPIMQR